LLVPAGHFRIENYLQCSRARGSKGLLPRSCRTPPEVSKFGSIPEVSFPGSLRVFGQLRRYFVRFNRISDNVPKNAGKTRFFL